MTDKLRQAVARLRRGLNLETRVGYLGDGTGEVHDRANPGRYHVRFPQADGTYTAPVSLPLWPNANLPTDDGTPVDVGYDKNDRQIILGVNLTSLAATDTNPLQLNPLDRQASDFINPDKLSPLYATRHADADNFPFSVIVFPGFFFLADALTFFTGGAVDVSGSQPAAGEHCYVVVFLKTDLTLEVTASTAVDNEDPIGSADIDEAVALGSAGSIPLKAWQLSGDDTALTVDDTLIVNLRVSTSSPTVGGGSDDSARYMAWIGWRG